MQQLLALLTLSGVTAAAASAQLPCGLTQAGNTLELKSGFARLVFDLVRGSVDVVQGRFEGDGNFSLSPNLAGQQAAPAGTRRGAIAVVVSGIDAGGESISTSSVDRGTPLTFKNTSSLANCGFSVTLSDSSNLLSATLTFELAVTTPRQITVGASAVASAAFSPSIVSLSTLWTPPSATGFYFRGAGGPLGVRQGMAMGGGFISSASPLRRASVIGDGATGAVEVLPLAADTGSSWLFGGQGSFATNGGVGVALWGAAQPVDAWTSNFDGGSKTPVKAGAASPSVSLAVFPNNRPFPTR